MSTDIRQNTIDAIAQAFRDAGLLNNAGYIDGDEERAAELAVETAEKVWPHAAPKRDPASSTHASLTIASSPYKPPAAARAEVFGFAPPGGWT